VTFIDPEGEFAGRQALSDQAQKLLDGVPAGFVFEEDGPRYVGTDTAAPPGRLGPLGNPVARGIDILTIRDDPVSVVRTLIASEADARSVTTALPARARSSPRHAAVEGQQPPMLPDRLPQSSSRNSGYPTCRAFVALRLPAGSRLV